MNRKKLFYMPLLVAMLNASAYLVTPLYASSTEMIECGVFLMISQRLISLQKSVNNSINREKKHIDANYKPLYKAISYATEMMISNQGKALSYDQQIKIDQNKSLLLCPSAEDKRLLYTNQDLTEFSKKCPFTLYKALDHQALRFDSHNKQNGKISHFLSTQQVGYSILTKKPKCPIEIIKIIINYYLPCCTGKVDKIGLSSITVVYGKKDNYLYKGESQSLGKKKDYSPHAYSYCL